MRKNSSIAYAEARGILVQGANNLIENCVIHDVNWAGNLGHNALMFTSTGGKNTAQKNTLYNVGNDIITFGGSGPTEIAFNHVYDGGLVSKDNSLIYTQRPGIRGSEIHHNCVHGCYPWDQSNGIGIRGDDQTRGLSVNYNVVWNCDTRGIVAKGDTNQVHHNTVFGIGTGPQTGYFI